MLAPHADGQLTQARIRLRNASRQRAIQAKGAAERPQLSVTEMVRRVASNPPPLLSGVTSASNVKAPARPIPLGWCGCGCGIKTRLAPKTRQEYGHVKGQPLRYIAGHNDSTGRGGYPLRPETVLADQKRREEQEAKAAAKAATRTLAATNPASHAPKTSYVHVPAILPATTGTVGGRGVNFYNSIDDREPAWSRHHDAAAPNRRPSPPSHTGYWTKRRTPFKP